MRGAGSDRPGPCDSADLTGLGLSAAVPPALVRLAGENSIPVRAAIFSREPHGGRKLMNLRRSVLEHNPPPKFAILTLVQLPCVAGNASTGSQRHANKLINVKKKTPKKKGGKIRSADARGCKA